MQKCLIAQAYKPWQYLSLSYQLRWYCYDSGPVVYRSQIFDIRPKPKASIQKIRPSAEGLSRSRRCGTILLSSQYFKHCKLLMNFGILCKHFGTVTQCSVYPTVPVLLTENFGKQNWHCGIDRTLSYSANSAYRKLRLRRKLSEKKLGGLSLSLRLKKSGLRRRLR